MYKLLSSVPASTANVEREFASTGKISDARWSIKAGSLECIAFLRSALQADNREARKCSQHHATMESEILQRGLDVICRGYKRALAEVLKKDDTVKVYYLKKDKNEKKPYEEWTAKLVEKIDDDVWQVDWRGTTDASPFKCIIDDWEQLGC